MSDKPVKTGSGTTLGSSDLTLPFSKIAELTVSAACAAVKGAKKKRLADVRLFDLVIQDQPNQGIYFFFAPDGCTCLYVGKNSSMQFTERLGMHFAVADESWQNHFLKAYKEHHKQQSLTSALAHAGDCRLLLMPIMPTDDGLAAKAETFFRIFQEPLFNSLKSRRAQRARESIGADDRLLKAIDEIG